MKMACAQLRTFNPRSRRSPKHARISQNGLPMGGKVFVSRFCFHNYRIDKHLKMALAQFYAFNPRSGKSSKHARIGQNQKEIVFEECSSLKAYKQVKTTIWTITLRCHQTKFTQLLLKLKINMPYICQNKLESSRECLGVFILEALKYVKITL